MRKLVCDGCGGAIHFAVTTARITRITLNSISSQTPLDIDLCQDCTDEFYHWLKEKPTGK